MATFLRSSRLWVIDFRYRGAARRWLKAYPASADVPAEVAALLQDLHEGRAVLTGLRPATPEEERDWGRGIVPVNAYCPSGRQPLETPRAPSDPPQPD